MVCACVCFWKRVDSSAAPWPRDEPRPQPESQGRNFGLKIGGTNSEGELSALGCKWRGEWEESIPPLLLV